MATLKIGDLVLRRWKGLFGFGSFAVVNMIYYGPDEKGQYRLCKPSQDTVSAKDLELLSSANHDMTMVRAKVEAKRIEEPFESE